MVRLHPSIIAITPVLVFSTVSKPLYDGYLSSNGLHNHFYLVTFTRAANGGILLFVGRFVHTAYIAFGNCEITQLNMLGIGAPVRCYMSDLVVWFRTQNPMRSKASGPQHIASQELWM